MFVTQKYDFMGYTEEQLRNFAASLKNTENQQCKNAIGMVRSALNKYGFDGGSYDFTHLFEDGFNYSEKMTSGRIEIKILIQGSYANKTNVKQNSDVDISIIQTDRFRCDYPMGVTDEHYGFSTAQPMPEPFKDIVEKALRDTFGSDVEMSDKSIHVKGNSNRKDVDVVPCLQYRDYRHDTRCDPNNYVPGIIITSDSGTTIINYPEQHIESGKGKNTNTHRYYKRMVRIFKKVNNIMQDHGIPATQNISSFDLESLLWNVPDGIYLINCPENERYTRILREIFRYLDTHNSEWKNYTEANGIKPLFPNGQKLPEMQIFYDQLKRSILG
jgi:hypothetical protein